VPYKFAIERMTNGLLSESPTWAEDRSWGYCTPIYMFDHIIRLQAVAEIITNETASALNLLAKQNTKMCNAIYQTRLFAGF
jgi:hypothetical protein